jgi:hypothetical protein
MKPNYSKSPQKNKKPLQTRTNPPQNPRETPKPEPTAAKKQAQNTKRKPKNAGEKKKNCRDGCAWHHARRRDVKPAGKPLKIVECAGKAAGDAHAW